MSWRWYSPGAGTSSGTWNDEGQTSTEHHNIGAKPKKGLKINGSYRKQQTNLPLQQGRMGEGTVRKFGIDMHTVLYLRWIPNKDLLSSTGNSAQRYVTAWMGAEFGGRMDTCIGMAESLCCPPETITTLLTGYTPIQNKKFNLKRERERALLAINVCPVLFYVTDPQNAVPNQWHQQYLST